MPAGVVGEVGADQAIGKSQLLIYRHTRHFHHHPAIIPAMDWFRWENVVEDMDRNRVVT